MTNTSIYIAKEFMREKEGLMNRDGNEREKERRERRWGQKKVVGVEPNKISAVVSVDRPICCHS